MNIEPNAKVGRWTVLDEYIKAKNGEKKWLCRCECGTERYVLERSLKHGGSLSCGCVRKEQSKASVAHNLIGKTFGDLSVIKPSDTPHTNGGVWWVCRCSCGNMCECPGTLLVKGRKTHCGCKTNRGRPTDITGRKFGRLTAVALTEERDRWGAAIWECVCDCGNKVKVSYNVLVYTDIQSCSCQKREHDQILRTLQTRVDGTSLDIIRSKKIPTDNTTGVKGVYFIRGKYVAKLVFQHKAYHLGTFKSLEEARDARREAEETVYSATLAYYEAWNKRALSDPVWAEQNPVKIVVSKRNGHLCTEFYPVLSELNCTV